MTYRRIERNEQLSDAEQLDVLRKQVKQRDDAIEQFSKGGREDLAAKERREREILGGYLPSELSADALRKAVADAIAPLGPAPQFGAAMKAAMAALKDQATGKAIQEAVRAAVDVKKP